jgi:hypothetical protein
MAPENKLEHRPEEVQYRKVGKKAQEGGFFPSLFAKDTVCLFFSEARSCFTQFSMNIIH